jgi:prepilin-type N-terminal cleavage/methylation domain-containing protein
MMFRDVKKGFTFVELAIVLVIIGIIMGMALKGRSLIEGAKIRSEVRKLDRIQAAMAGWFGNTGSDSTPTQFRQLSSIAPTCLAADGYTSATVTGTGQICLDVRVLPEINAGALTHSYGDNWTMYGASWGVGAALAQGSSYILITTASPRFACNVENMMEQGNKYFSFGDVRASYNEWRTTTTDLATGDTPLPTVTTNPPDASFRTCDEWSNTYLGGASYLGYQLAL